MTATPSFNRTRIAPTPSGFLHLGNVLSFAITAALARQTGATILLRIDDLDRERVHREYIQDIFDTLNFMEIPWDEGPRNAQQFEQEYSQLHRAHLYHDALQQLATMNTVFACTCSRSQVLQSNIDGFYPGTCTAKNIVVNTSGLQWRVHTPVEKQFTINTWSGGKQFTTLPPSMQYFIVRKKDGSAAYQLASLIDDLHFGVNLIVRGKDLYASTVAQLYLASLLQQPGFLNTTFHHHPLLMNTNNAKLSKSAGDTSVQRLRKQGKTAADIYTTIGKALGYSTTLNNWQQLAVLFTEKNFD